MLLLNLVSDREPEFLVYKSVKYLLDFFAS